MSVDVRIVDKTARVSAPAKVNLFIEILGKRPDGFHEIVTVMQAVSIFDTVTVTRRPGDIAVTCDAEDAPSGPQNIAWHAAEAVLGALHADDGVHVRIDKTIPVGRGLGGGSSDAAAVISAANQLWGGTLDMEALGEIAADLGSDVPFFLHGGTALCRGRGEDVKPIKSALRAYFVILSPPLSISTRSVYESENLDKSAPQALTNAKNQYNIVLGGLQRGDFVAVANALYNGFSETLFRIYPELFISYSRFVPHFEAAAVTGTGSALFGLCSNKCQAQAVAGRLYGSSGDVYVAEALI